ncbi:hypothetical protein VPNG_09303 [Cytospora leucostoma]|uniref:Uncharacterized protein n=1 Tax=Cytospora leucostoma TaxID=1230097 RepID=A0A423VUR3_9PEZI|nr:hypothetical protein VPNG_09303 [Cytospora leucostoma]
MKYIFDSFSGDFAAIDVPYNLDMLSSKNMPQSGTRTLDDDDENENESVRRLTVGVVLVTEEVDVHFENRSPSPNGSHGSFDIA